MSKRIIFLVAAIVCFASFGFGAKKFTLVIDPGHGGKDAGALGAFSKEKNINLNVALAFGRLVERNCPDVRVIYTRKTDVFISLNGRAEIANKNKADLFISIHTNSVAKKGNLIRGMETYTLGNGKSNAKQTNLDVAKRENSVIVMEKDYKLHYEGYDPNSPESNIMFEFIQDKNLSNSVDLAKMIQKNSCRIANRPNRGVYQDNFLVLRCTSMPACLVELGYISTPAEEKLLNSESYKNNIARGMYNAFIEYKHKYDKKSTVTYKKLESQTVEEAPQKAVAQKENNTVEQNDKTVVAQNDKKEDRAEEKKEDRKDEKKFEEQPKTAMASSFVNLPDTATDTAVPVFKIQVLTSSTSLRNGCRQFKGLENLEMFEEGNIKKYTYGSSADYNEIYRLRKTILDKFPDAFIIAFKNDQKMDVVEAIKEYKTNKNKK